MATSLTMFAASSHAMLTGSEHERPMLENIARNMLFWSLTLQ
ncbi:MAG: hypothetical protein ACXWPS_03385 [Ktedonobacteraceae bacterium]